MVANGIGPRGSSPLVSAERAFERLSDDETLRGSLEDDAYAPLLDFIARLALAKANRFSSTDALYDALRSLLVAAVRAAEWGDAGSIANAIRPFVADEHGREFRAAVGKLGSDQTENARAIVRALADATGVSPDA